jgi:hypothetical protein
MKTLARSIALVACFAGAAALVPDSALAAGGRGFSGSGHSFNGGAGWHGGRGGGFHGGPGFHRGFSRPGFFWGGVGVGLGIGAVGYYNGWWGPYGYAPYYYDGYYYDQAPAVVVSPAAPVDPATRSGQPVPQSSRSADPIFYPNKGQSAATTEADRRECNRWATGQSGAMTDASIFQRATLACMEGRGYTVR